MTAGGISPHALAHVGYLAQRAKGRAALSRDGTKYGRSRTSPRSFFVHHTQRIACGAQQFDARGIRKKIALEKQKLMNERPRGGPLLGGSAIYEVIGWGLAGSDLCTV